MIIVQASARIPDGVVDELRGEWATLISTSRAEAGCLDYCIALDVLDQNVVRITERWDSLDALSAHAKTPHVADWVRTVADIEFSDETLRIFNSDGEDMSDLVAHP